jgi:ribosome-binding factor A
MWIAMTRRTERINDLLEEEISELLRREVKDPRLGDLMITVTEVDVSADLRHAKVFVSVMGSEEEQAEALRALEGASAFLRRELHKRLELRRTPELAFHRDDSLERAAHITDLLRQISEERQE